MKKILLLIFVLLFTHFCFSQTYTLNSATSGTTISTCSGTFVDDGGSAANYSINQNTTITFCPATPGDVIKVTFTSLALRATGTGACQDVLDIYQGNATYAAPLIAAGTPDDRLCGTYIAPNLPVFYSTSSSGCITFNFISDGSQVLAGWTASITCITPCTNPTAAITNTSVLNICGPASNSPGALTVNFNASNSTLGSYGPGGSTVTLNNYQWNFGDGTTLSTSTPTTSHTYPNTPGVYVMKLSVRDNNIDVSSSGCSSTNSVTKIIRVLPAPSFTGTTVSPQNIGCGSNATLTGIATSQTETQNIPAVSGVTVSLPDGSGGSFVSNADFSGLFPIGSTLTAGCYPILWFNLEHSYTGDLTIDLISPSGLTVRVFNRHGVGGMFGPIYMFGSCVDGADDLVPGCGATYSVANSGGQSWTNYGATAITTTSSSPCAGYIGPCQGGTATNPYYTPTLYNSTNSFAALNGSPLNGIWQIKITDNLAQDDGFLFSWGLVFPSSCYTPLESITPDLTTAIWTNGGAGLAVPVSQTTTSITVIDPGPDACPIIGTCSGNQLTNTINFGPFNTPGTYPYLYTVTDEFGCTYTNTVNVAVSCACPSLTAMSYAGPYCRSINSQITPTVSGSGAIASGSYSSTPVGLSIDILSGVVTPSLSIANTYTITYSVAATGGCSAISINTLLTISSTPTVIASASNSVICLGNSTSLTSSGASTYTWSGGVTNGTAFSPTSTASYTVTGTSASGCTNTAVQTISVSPNPTVTASASNSVICLGNSTSLTAIGASTYTWTGGVTNGTAFSPTATASYTVTGTSATGCTNTAVQTITVNPIPTTTASATGTINCTTPTITLNSSLAGVNYTWTAPSGGSVSSANTQSTSVSGAAGIYTLNVQSTAGCTYSTTASVTQNTTTPTGLSAGSNQTLTCSSTSVALNGSITTPTNATVLWTGPSVSGSTTSFSTSANGAGVYTLTATNPINGCTATSTVQVSPSAGAPSLTINPVTNTITCTNTLVTVSISSTVSSVSYIWSGPGIVSGTGTGTITVDQGGTYNFTLTNTTNSCTTSNNQVVVQNITPPTATASNTTTLTCSTTAAVLTGGGGGTYVWTGPSIIGGGSTSTPTVNASGNYTVTVTAANGCTAAATASVTQNSTPPTATASNTTTLTCSTTAAVLTGGGGGTYAWTGPSITGGGSTSTPTVNASGNYTVTVTAANGCTAASTASVTQNITPPTATASNSTTLTCSTTSAVLTGGGGGTYVWTGPSIAGGGSTSTPTVNASGNYTVTVTAANGCTAAATASVTQNITPPAATASNTTTLTCSTTAAVLTGGGGGTYVWTGPSIAGGGLTSTPTVNASGNYTVTVTAANGCTAAATASVSQNTTPPTPTASNTTTLTCSTTAAVLTGGGGGTYVWTGPSITGGGSTSTPTVNASGNYTVTVTAANGCTAAATTSVLQNITAPTTTASASGSLTCLPSSTVSLSSTLSGMNYTWTAPSGGLFGSANSQNTSASGAAGIYTLSVVDPTTGCSFTTTTSVSQNAIVPTTTASVSGVLTCSTLTVDLNSTLAGMNYTWTTPVPSTINTQSTTATIPGNYTLSVLDPSNSCSFTTNISVTQNTTTPAGLSAGSNQTLTCTSASVNLTGSISTPTNSIINWTGASVCGTATTLVTSACGAGVYTLTATNPLNGCIATSTVQVSPSAGAPLVTNNPVTNTITCTNTLVTVSISTSVTPVTYAWSGAGIVGTTTLSSISVSQGGTFQYTVTNTSSGCTTSNNQVVISNTTAPSPTASNSTTLTCATTTAALTGSGGGIYSWSGPGLILGGSTSSPTVNAVGDYTLTVTEANGCAAVATTSVSQNTTVPSPTASNSTTLTCTTTTASLSGGPSTGVTYQWLGGGLSGSTTNQNAEATSAGMYTLTVTDAVNSCTASATTSVIQNTVAPIGLTAGTNQTLTCPSNSLTLNGSITTPTNATILWTGPSITGSTNSYTTTVNGAGVYTLTATDPVNSCSVAASVEVYPNAGSPVASITSTALVIDCNSASQSVTVTSVPSTDVTYSWNTAPSSLSSDGTVAAFTNASTYICTVTNTVSNCSTPVQIVVTSNTTVPTTTLSVSGILTCSTLSVDLNSTLAGMNYTWTTPVPSTINTQSTTVTIAGDYTLSVLDPANGCSYTTTISVAQNTTTPIGLSAGINQTLTCPSNSLTLNGSITTPTNANVIWTGPSITGSTNSYTTTVTGAGIYTLTATDPVNNCIATSIVEVFPNAGSPVASITSTALVIDCNNASQSVTVTSVPSTDVTYNWNTAPSSLSSNGTIATFTNANTYICTLTNTLSNCSTPVQVVVTSNTTVPIIAITQTQTLTCATPTAAITLTTAPSTGLTYTWTGTLLSGQGTDLITVNQPGNYSVVVTNAANGCTNTASSQVDVDVNLPNASINITSTNSVITCSNQSVDLTVNVSPLAAYNYTWSTASTATNINVTSANVYSVTVVNPTTGCSVVALYTVTSNTISPTVQTTNTVIPCNTTTVNVIATSTSAVTYSWTSTNGILLTNGTSNVIVGSTGDYVVTVIDINNGCVSTASASVSQTTINSSFTANPLSGTAPLLVDFTNTSNNPAGTTYSWNFGDSNTANITNASNTYTLIGNYTVTLTATDAASLCTATSTINIEVLENSYISVPNVFTPNGDNANDVFKIDTRGIKDLTCEIFNRWGSKIYTLIATKDSWDGLNQSAGTYFYILSAEGYDGKEYKQQGFISLLK